MKQFSFPQVHFAPPGAGDYSACGRSAFFAAEKGTKKPPKPTVLESLVRRLRCALPFGARALKAACRSARSSLVPRKPVLLCRSAGYAPYAAAFGVGSLILRSGTERRTAFIPPRRAETGMHRISGRHNAATANKTAESIRHDRAGRHCTTRKHSKRLSLLGKSETAFSLSQEKEKRRCQVCSLTVPVPLQAPSAHSAPFQVRRAARRAPR